MKVLYVTIKDPTKQGDFQEVMCLRALRSALGDNCIDYPRKKILYGDFSEVDRPSFHGKGFTLYDPIPEVKDRDFSDVDVVVYGFVNKNNYVNDYYPELESLNKPVVYIDGHDDSDIVKTPCFKHELFEEHSEVYPLRFSIPSSKIQPIDLTNKTQLIQSTAPPYSRFGPQVLGIPARQLYVFDDEEEYYDDMARSWFGLTCRKGSWDSLRHLEIMAAGSLLLFRDLADKPSTASPHNLPAPSYSSAEELETLITRLLPNGQPSEAYKDLLLLQRDWLLTTGVEEALGKDMVSTLEEHLKNEN
mgnify:CR=1 FL=1|jgi:hypothetical protein|tara:strand:- start:7331 stop:8239 length:909 start_codon:yes stop_codon:yes gene_type:complete